MISGVSIDRCVHILLTTFYHTHHYTMQLPGRWSRVHYTVMFDNNYFSHSVPPLTQGNVLEAVKGVQDWDRLRYYFGIDPVSSLEDAVEEFLLGRGFYQPSWRAIIFILDLMDKVQIADRIRNHGEPVQGGCVYFPSAAPII